MPLGKISKKQASPLEVLHQDYYGLCNPRLFEQYNRDLLIKIRISLLRKLPTKKRTKSQIRSYFLEFHGSIPLKNEKGKISLLTVLMVSVFLLTILLVDL